MILINSINRYGLFAYAIAIVSSIIFNMLGFEIINPTVSNIFKVLYFIILLWAIVSFYKSKKKSNASIILIFLPLILLFSGIPFKMITIVMVFPLFFFKGIKDGIRVVGTFVFSICILLGTIGLFIEGFGINTVIGEKYSPDGLHRVVTIDSDQGALGGDTIIRLEKVYFGAIKKNVKCIYRGKWGEKPTIFWKDNDIVNINERDININTDKMWDNKY